MGITIRKRSKSKKRMLNHVNVDVKNPRKPSFTTDKLDYKILYEGSPTLLRTINTNGIIIACNRAYAEHLGYTKKEIIGKSIFDHVAKKNLGVMHDSFETWKKKGKVTNVQIWFQRKDGTSFPALLSATNMYDKNKKLIGSNTAIRDITEIFNARKKIDAKDAVIKKQLKSLRELDLVKDEFLAMVTHELKTPLVPIKSYADILLSEIMGPLNDRQKERLEIIRSSTGVLLKLISDIFDAQKIELGHLTLKKEINNLSEIINETINQMKPNVEHNNVAITADLQQDMCCLCDKARITQVLSNIIINALDFCPKQNGKIHIKSYQENRHAKIIVKDNGIGITKSNLGKIFAKFYQINTKTTREHGGTGLGLSVCKGIVESHDGKIWAASKGRNKGAEIHVLLPLTNTKNNK